jgi:hypothetical protein
MWSRLVTCVNYWYVLLLFLFLSIVCAQCNSVLCCLLPVTENNGEFSDTLWPSDNKVVLNDGVYDSEI